MDLLPAFQSHSKLASHVIEYNFSVTPPNEFLFKIKKDMHAYYASLLYIYEECDGRLVFVWCMHNMTTIQKSVTVNKCQRRKQPSEVCMCMVGDGCGGGGGGWWHGIR